MSRKQQTEELRIYVAVAATIQVPAKAIVQDGKVMFQQGAPLRSVVQPAGRQVAQVAHVVSKLRHEIGGAVAATPVEEAAKFVPVTTIVLQARDSAEMGHIHYLSLKKRLKPVVFSDTNNFAYGPGAWPTAVAVYATRKQVEGIFDYLPLWGSESIR